MKRHRWGGKEDARRFFNLAPWAGLSALLLTLSSCGSARSTNPLLEPSESGALDGGTAGGGGMPGLPDVPGVDPQGPDAGSTPDGGTAPIPVGSVILPDHFVPQFATSDGRDVLFLFARDSDRILRWSQSANDSLPPIQLDPARGTPAHIAFAPESDRLYIGYGSGQVTFVDAALEEHDFVQVRTQVTGLVAAGAFMVVEDRSGDAPPCQAEPPCAGDLGYFVRHVFDGQGGLTATREHEDHHGAVQAYDPVSRRVFFLNEPEYPEYGGPGPLMYDQLDASGAIVASKESVASPLYSDFLGPIRVSPDGARLYLGTRDTFDAESLERRSAMPGSVLDAQWLSDGAIASIRAVEAGTWLERRDARGRLLEAMTVASRPIALVPMGGNRLVLVGTSGRPEQPMLTPWAPNDDTDGDGTPNVSDGFPWEPAAALDSDRDGAPDAWNAGYPSGAAALELDAYPSDSACQRPGTGACNIAASIPAYAPDQIAVDAGGVIYLLSVASRRVFRWDTTTGRNLNPLVLGVEGPFDPVGPRNMAYSAAHHRLYLGYDGGAIGFIELAGGLAHEQLLGHLPLAVESVAAVGDFVLARDASGGHIFDAGGALRDQRNMSAFSRVFAHDPVSGRVYYVDDLEVHASIGFERIDPTSGVITDFGSSNNDLEYAPPIRVSPDGARVLIGTGDVYDAQSLVWSDNVLLPSSVRALHDAHWLADGGVVTMRGIGRSAWVERRREGDFALVDQLRYSGTPLALLPVGNAFFVVTLRERPQFARYLPNDDSDADGVPSLIDAFPRDPAAAVDSDGDGFPDAWNLGQSEATTTSGLVLDAFPVDSACSSTAQGPLGSCDIEAALPRYVGEVASDEAGILYLLGSGERRVFRWNSVEERHLNPIVVGSGDPIDPLYPDAMALPSGTRRLYLGYSRGAITYIELDGDLTVEHDLASFPGRLDSLTTMGSLLHARVQGYRDFEHVVVDAAGSMHPVMNERYHPWPIGHSFDPVRSRMYFFGRGLPQARGLLYETFDLTTGVLTDFGGMVLGDDEPVTEQPPIRISRDGERILTGSGDIYEADGFTRSGGLPADLPGELVDALWLPDGGVVTLRRVLHDDFSSTTVFERRTAALDLAEAVEHAGIPIGLAETAAGLVVVTLDEVRTSFHIDRPGDD